MYQAGQVLSSQQISSMQALAATCQDSILKGADLKYIDMNSMVMKSGVCCLLGVGKMGSQELGGNNEKQAQATFKS